MFITALAPFRAGGTQYSNTHLSPLTTHQSFRTGVLAKGLFSPPSPLKGGTEVVLFFQVLMFFTTPAPFRAGGTQYSNTHHSPLTTHHSPLTTHLSPLTTHHSPLPQIKHFIHLPIQQKCYF